MKIKIIVGLILANLSISAFALPQRTVQPLLFESKASSIAERNCVNHVAEGGAERLLERMKKRTQLVEGGAERTGVNRVAEGGAERLLERMKNHAQLTEDGNELTAS